MKISRAALETCGQETDTVVVIDVLRAYTTAAVAFAQGTREIVLVSSVEEAFGLRARFPGALLVGEVKGYPVEGFDFGNSPSVLSQQDLAGRRLILRTSAGTQGVVRSVNARHILATGLCTASATVRQVLDLSPRSLTLVETGVLASGWGDEDVACADLIAAKLTGGEINVGEIERRVRQSWAGRRFGVAGHAVFPAADLEAALQIDRFDFAMGVRREDGVLILRPIG